MRLIRPVLFAASLVVVVSGCSASVGSTPTVSTDKLETTIADKLEAQVGQRPEKISCPDALKGKVGTKVRCSLTDGSTTYGISVTTTSVKDKNVRFNILVDDKPQ